MLPEPSLFGINFNNSGRMKYDIRSSVGHRRSTIIWGLGLTQVIGYGTLYYSFFIHAPEMAKDFSWSQEWAFGVFPGPFS
jgi:hypothetical protein